MYFLFIYFSFYNVLCFVIILIHNMFSLEVISANDGDTVLAAKAIENGALLFLVHPITKETLQYLRQHVMREKLMTSKNEKHILEGKRCVEVGNRILDNYSVNKRAANMFMEKGKSQVNEECDPKINSNFVVKRKASIEWTEELQAKFWETTNFLGEGSMVLS